MERASVRSPDNSAPGWRLKLHRLTRRVGTVRRPILAATVVTARCQPSGPPSVIWSSRQGALEAGAARW